VVMVMMLFFPPFYAFPCGLLPDIYPLPACPFFTRVFFVVVGGVLSDAEREPELAVGLRSV
jgi:hypothetical protein